MNCKFHLLFIIVPITLIGVVVFVLFWGDDERWPDFVRTTSERSATISSELSNGTTTTTTTLHVTSPTTKPFSVSVVGMRIDMFGRERVNSSEIGQFRGDVFVNGGSMRQTLEREFNIKCGMVKGDYSIKLGDIINIWFYSKRTTVNLVGINQEFGSLCFSCCNLSHILTNITIKSQQKGSRTS